MRAILVSVEYDDLLSLTLPWNRRHFDEVAVVTAPHDEATIKVALANSARVITTDAFWRHGADFNKWLALEEGLELFGRHGLMCLMDADVLWPQGAPSPHVPRGWLFSPRRRIWPDVTQPPPPEDRWGELPLFTDFEHAGYSQVFWADDPHLPPPPWHQVDWRHAGGADSFFQALWPPERKLRSVWEVLHLGAPGRNWMGRATARSDGKDVPLAGERMRKLTGTLLARSHAAGGDPFSGERIG